MSQRLVWTSAAHSDIGKVRRVNEDACLERPHVGAGGLWAVADGMGGHTAGDVASRVVIDALREVQPAADEASFSNYVQQAVARANTNLLEQAAYQYQNRTVGTTVAILLAYDRSGVCLWAGDSRIYRLRNGQLQQLTHDHSHVQELVDRGVLEPAAARHHPMANVITRAVGVRHELSLDSGRFDLAGGDVFLLCSDGLSKLLTDDEIAQLMDGVNSRTAVQKLIDSALARGADDNVTTVVVSIHEVDDAAEDETTIPLAQLAARLRQQG